ncbi:MAG: S8 family serine peptidase [Alkaliphilus sp.]
MRFKKLLSVVLTVVMVFGTLGFAFAEDVEVLENQESTFDAEYYFNFVRELRKQERPDVEALQLPPHKFDDNAPQFEPSDEVRFIVEVEGTPIIMKQGGTTVSGNKAMLEADQNSVINMLNAIDPSIEVRHSFFQGINGFSISSKYMNLEEIKALPGVLRVHVARQYELDMQYSVPIIGLESTWQSNKKGQGTVVAVLDTGIYWSHKDFAQAPLNPKFTESEMAAMLAATDFDDKVLSAKVIAGWDFADLDNDVKPDFSKPHGHDHGSHVAGTVLANGEIKGVAPEAQLLVAKVFSCESPFAWTDDIIAGINWSVQMGADVINMSLGSTAAFVEPDAPYDLAINAANAAGVVVAVSAGNSNISTGFMSPLAINPDIGLVGSPSLEAGTISVASFENTHITSPTIERGDGTFAAYASGTINPQFVLCKITAFEYEYAGLGGDASYFAHADFNGKVALIMRGVYAFTQKILEAQEAGAIAVIVFNDAARGDALANMAGHPDITIPSLFIGHTNGANMRDEATNRTVIFSGPVEIAGNPNAGRMSSFTSWGLTPNLDFKPEITAPGGNIWSTMSFDTYASMSGTSMAAPHMAGASALMAQVLNERGYSGLKRSWMSQVLTMNTATPIVDIDSTFNTFISPRRQGAGLLQVDKALATPAYVFNLENNEPSIALREIGDTRNFTLRLMTLDTATIPVHYEVYATVLTNRIEGPFLRTEMVPVTGAVLSTSGIDITTVTHTVYAGAGSTNLHFTLDLSNAGINHNSFVEGFIEFKPGSGNPDIPALSIPFVGFYGDWDGPEAPRVVDRLHYEADTFLPYTGLYDISDVEWAESLAVWGWTLDLLVDNRHVLPWIADAVISPNADGNLDAVSSGFTMLRNARTFDLFVEDDTGNRVKDIYDQEFFRKTVLPGTWMEYSSELLSWHGLNNAGTLVSDGQYNIIIETKVDFPTATVQRTVKPIMVDVTAPVVNGITVVEQTAGSEYLISWQGQDATSGITYFDVFVHGAYVGWTSYPVKELVYSGTEPKNIVVVATDRAINMGIAYIDGELQPGEGIITSATARPVVQIDPEPAPGGTFMEILYASSMRPVWLDAGASASATWTVEILDPNNVKIDEIFVSGALTAMSIEWAPNAHAINGMYTAKFIARDIEAKISVKEVEFEVYNHNAKIVGLELQQLDGQALETVTRGASVFAEVNVQNLGPISLDMILIAKVTDSDGNIVHLGSVEYGEWTFNAENRLRVGFTIPSSKPLGGYTVDVYVWDGWDSMNPLSTHQQIEFIVVE